MLIKDFNKKIYFLYGKDKPIVRENFNFLLSKIIKNKDDFFDLAEFDGEFINLDKFEDTLNMYPVKGDVKCIVIKNIDIEKFSAGDIEKINNILKEIPDFSVVIICQTFCEVNEKKSLKWKKFLKLVSDIGESVNCCLSSEKLVEDRIIDFALKKNKMISRENANLILKLCSRNLSIIFNELEKLCNFASEKEISSNHIEKIVCPSSEYNIFEICNFIFSKNSRSAHECLRKLFLFKEDPVAILSIISSTYVDIYRFKICHNHGVADAFIPKFFDYKGKEYKIKFARRNAENISLENLRESINILLSADEEIKNINVNPQVIVEIAVIKLISLIKHGSSQFEDNQRLCI